MGGQRHVATSRGRPSCGFTLIELVAVVAVAGVLAVVAAPSLANLGAAREDLAASRVRALLAFAQETAMASNTDTWVAFDTSAETATAWVEDAANPGKANRVALLDPLTRAQLVVTLGQAGHPGLSSADFGSTTEVQFDQDGVPYGAAGVALTADGTAQLDGGTTIRVRKTTGLVTVD